MSHTDATAESTEPRPAPPICPSGGHRTPAEVSARVRAVVVDATPAFGFTLTFAPTRQVLPAVCVALTIGLLVTAVRIARRHCVWRPLCTLGLVGVGALLASRSGHATSFFLPQLVMHVGSVLVSLVLLLSGFPVAGLVMGWLTGEGLRWRRCRTRRRAYRAASLVLLLSSTLTTSAFATLFLLGDPVAVGVLDMANPFVVTLAVLGAWRAYRQVMTGHAVGDCTGSPDSPRPLPVGPVSVGPERG